MEKRLNCIIIDDEPLARELLKAYVDKTPSLNLTGVYESAVSAMKSVMEGKTDLIFLDINMPTLNGIDFASMVPTWTRIIFVTAYDNYALQGFKVNALDYLLKPVSYADFLKSVSRAVEWKNMRDSLDHACQTEQSRPQTITVKVRNQLIQMRLDTIEYIEAQNDRVIIYRKGGEALPSLMTLREIEEMLPTDSFMRVHRSFIVNIPLVEIVERNRIVFGKNYVPISENKREEFLSRLGK